MEARFFRPLLGIAAAVAIISTTAPRTLAQIPPGFGSRMMGPNAVATNAGRVNAGRGGRQYVVVSENFRVFADSPQWAQQVSAAAERYRRELAIYWLGAELPTWFEKCPVHVRSGQNLGASGETSFSLARRGRQRTVGGWTMIVAGTPERILDSVLPHEISHTIFATHFAPLGDYMPRWADEGACTTVEHDSEKAKHRDHLIKYLRHGRGLAFNRMFSLKDYPRDILPLYAQGHSVVQFLIDQGGARRFIQFVGQGMRTQQWEEAVREHYEYQTIGEMQELWNRWLADGRPEDLLAYAPSLQNNSRSEGASSIAQNARNQPTSGSTLLASAESGIQPDDPPALSSRAGSDANVATVTASWYRRRLEETTSGAAVSDARHAVQPPSAQQQSSSNTQSSPAATQPMGSQAKLASTNLRSKNRVNANQTMIPLSPYQPNQAPADSGSTSGNRPHFPADLRRRTAHPQPVQSNGVRVLDWGASEPVRGVESKSIYR